MTELGAPRDLPTIQPPLALVQRWKSMPPWQAKRARAAWYRDYGQGAQDPTTVAPMPQLPERQGPRESIRGPRRLTNEELAARTARRAELDDPGYAGTLTEADLMVASPATVSRWLNSGKIHRDLGGPPPGRR